jgi:hypothetical protein
MASGGSGGSAAGPSAPANTVAPVISGSLTVGSLLTSTTGTWTNTPTSYAYQWQRDGVDIGGATSSTFTTANAGVHRCRVSATNAGGTGGPVNSNTLTITAPAAGSIIQQTPKQLVSNLTNTTFTATNAFPSMPTPGNSLVAMISVFNAPAGVAMTVTIGGVVATPVPGGVWQRVAGRHGCWYVPAVGGSPNRNIVITFDGAADYKYITYAALECSPLAASPVDFASIYMWQDNVGSPVGWPQTLTAPTPTTQASVLILAQTTSGSGMLDCLINSPAAGSTSLWYEINADSFQGGECSYRILSSIQTPTMAWSKRAGTTADHWDTVFVGLKFA